MSKWIKCSEKLPKNGQRVLIYGRSLCLCFKGLLIADFNISDDGEINYVIPGEGTYVNSYFVSHWQELPEEE